MEQIFTRYADMPGTIRAYTATCTDGSYTIVLNSRLCFEQQKKAFMHEVSHIHNRDYEIQTDVGILEAQRHRS